jgi:hypothetical protein
MVERSFDGPARVSGSAGTGKTVVALHRAVRLARADPARRILLATFSEPLARELASKVKVLAPEASGIVPRITVSDWANVADELFQLSTGRRPRIAGAEALAELIATAAAEADVRGFSDRFLLSEWTNVVDAWGIDGLEAYAQVPRLGRRSPLGPKQRERLWSVFDRVRSALSARGLFTRSSVYRQVAADYRVRTDKPFGAIIVDEAQDLGPAELVFLSAITPGHADALFFAGDLGGVVCGRGRNPTLSRVADPEPKKGRTRNGIERHRIGRCEAEGVVKAFSLDKLLQHVEPNF